MRMNATRNRCKNRDMGDGIRIVLAAALVAAAVIAAGHASAPTAFACSADETWDPRAESDVIIGGQVLGYEVLPEPSAGIYQKVRLNIRIDHVWKGGVSGREIVDGASYVLREDRWLGSGGACGAFDDDPAGRYVVLGLYDSGQGQLLTTSLRTFYIGDDPYNPASVVGFGRFPLGLPLAGGHDSPTFDWGVMPTAVALGVLALAVTLLGAGVRLRRTT